MHAVISFALNTELAETNPYPAGHLVSHSDAFGPEYFAVLRVADGHLVQYLPVLGIPETPG